MKNLKPRLFKDLECVIWNKHYSSMNDCEYRELFIEIEGYFPP